MNGAVPLAFIPWFLLPALSLGPITIQSFGVLSALGILLATVLTSRAARELGKDPQVPVDFAVAGVLAGVVGGHLVHLLAYHPEELHEPVAHLHALGGALLDGRPPRRRRRRGRFWFRVKRVRFSDYADAFALGIAPGWGVARIGCFTVHDHPGVLTSFPLAVRFPDGPRHDLGLYEAILLLSLGAALWVLHRRGALRGALLPLLAVVYGIGRFFLDFLRARDVVYADARHLGLTFAQYTAVVLVAWGAAGLVRVRRGSFAAAAPR